MIMVVPPGQHITLGVFFRLFLLLENKTHELDLKYAVDSGKGGSSYENKLGT